MVSPIFSGKGDTSVKSTKEDINFLREGLKHNTKSKIPNFESRYVAYLTPRSHLSIVAEKMTSAGRGLARVPVDAVGIGKRAVVAASSVEFNVSKRIKPKDQGFLDFNLVPPLPHYKLKFNELQRESLAEILQNADPRLSEMSRGLTAKYLSGNYVVADLSFGERQVLDEVNLRATQKQLTQIALLSKNPKSVLSQFAKKESRYQYQEAVVAEVLAKSLAYNQSLDGRIIEVPVPVGSKGLMKLVSFTIKKSHLGDKLPYYTLEPVEEPLHRGALYASKKEIEQFARPWLVIRGTEPLVRVDKEGVEESLVADLVDEEGVSSLPVNHGSDKILSDLMKLTKAGRDGRVQRPVNITGHSLGGSLAQTIGVLFNPLVNRTYAFNSPGVDSYVHRLYEGLSDRKHPEKLSEAQEKIIVFHRQGDLISNVSPKRVGQNFEIEVTGKERDIRDVFTRHADLMLNVSHKQKDVDTVKDEKKFMRKVSEWTRSSILSKAVKTIMKTNYGWYNQRVSLRDFGSKYQAWLKEKNLFK